MTRQAAASSSRHRSWRAAQQLQARWAGVWPLLSRWRQRRAGGAPRWRWDTLAFDDQSGGMSGGPQALWSQLIPFLIVSFSLNSVMPSLMTDRIAGRDALHFGTYAGYLLMYATFNLVLRVSHWRLKLAPGSPPPHAQVVRMLADSTSALAATALGVLGYHAWRQGLDPATLALPAARALLDAAFCVGLAAWLRGLCNRSAVVLLATLGLLGMLIGGLWLLHVQGLAVPRGAAVLAGQAVAAAGLMGLALRAWRRRVPRGANASRVAAAA